MARYDYRNHDAGDASTSRPSPGISPGKRTLTQALPAGPSLRAQERAVADFDAIDDAPDTRAVIDAPASGDRKLTNRQLTKARRRNPYWIERLKLSAPVFSPAPVGSDEFALDVAAKQAELGVAVDGIVGPATAAAAGATAASTKVRSPGAAARPAPRAILDRDGDMLPDGPDVDASRAVADQNGDMIPDAGQVKERAIVDADGDMMPDELANEDPFSMHLLGRH